jgi:hypothetical protein
VPATAAGALDPAGLEQPQARAAPRQGAGPRVAAADQVVDPACGLLQSTPRASVSADG